MDILYYRAIVYGRVKILSVKAFSVDNRDANVYNDDKFKIKE